MMKFVVMKKTRSCADARPQVTKPSDQPPSDRGRLSGWGAGMQRRQFSAIVLASISAGLAKAQSPAGPLAASLPLARSLPDEAARAFKRGEPLVVLVSLEGCTYCRLVRESYLAPWMAQGLPVVQIDWRGSLPLQDFGATGTHDDAARRLRIRVAPTLLFFGPEGREVAPRLVGVANADFYGAYLDMRIEQARRAMKS